MIRLHISPAAIILVLLCCLEGTACKKTFLDEHPLNQITDATYWTQPDDAVQFVTNLYKSLPTASFVYYEGMSDNGVSNNTTTRRFGNSTEDATISDREWTYTPIRQAYEYFANVGKVPGMDAALRSR